ncbi:hypothetical protein MMC30_004806 [Trapelia coarctata]|nr:hypothetical protein [Trapelia coarctata]
MEPTHRPQILYAIPISTESFLLGFEAHSFWWPRMHTFRLCMQQRSTDGSRLTLPEELICVVQTYVQAAGIEYSQNSFRHRNAARTQREVEEVLRYIASVFNVALVPSRRGGQVDPEYLYLCCPWWPVPRGALGLQRWHDEKSARPEISDFFAYFGWRPVPQALSVDVLMADDSRAVGPSKDDVVRLNDAISALGLGVMSVRRDGEAQREEERVDERELERAGRRAAARDCVADGDITVDYVDDSRTGRKLWQPRRLYFNSAETY